MKRTAFKRHQKVERAACVHYWVDGTCIYCHVTESERKEARPVARFRRRKPIRTPEDRAHLDMVHAQPCIACRNAGRLQKSRTVAHHIREGYGMAQRAPDVETLPLCEDCHRQESPTGFHRSPAEWVKRNGTERELLTQFEKEMRV